MTDDEPTILSMFANADAVEGQRLGDEFLAVFATVRALHPDDLPKYSAAMQALTLQKLHAIERILSSAVPQLTPPPSSA